jgi:hypothetical protein
MQILTPTRLAATSGFACAALLFLPPLATAQVKPSATQPPSSLPAAQPAPTPPPPLTPAQQEPKHAQVAYADGTLSISADNSSLNQILRQISNETGMKITGGVADERVFGQYGPAAPSQVLATLLDGTGSNMLFLHRDGNTPAELVLTPRTGGPSPPNPNAAVFDERPEPDERSEPQEGNRHRGPMAANQSRPASSTPAEASSPTGATPSDASQPDSPNGVKTPQQIYNQLQRMRSQQQQTSSDDQ